MTNTTHPKLSDLPRRWRPVPGSTIYFVSDDGLVASLARDEPRLLKPFKQTRGFLQLELHGHKWCVHDLVRRLFGVRLDPRTLKPLS
jgi:hypothetical protein